MAAAFGRVTVARGGLLPATLGLILGISACAGLAPGGNLSQVVDVEGIGTVEVAEFSTPPPKDPNDPNGGNELFGMDPVFTDRWTAAKVVLQTEGGQLLVVWNGGPAACWALSSIHFTGRGPMIDASVGERPVPVPGGCEGDRRYRAIFVPLTAAPAKDETSVYPIEP